MDRGTIEVYNSHAAQWATTRSARDEDAARRFRALVGRGLIVDIGCGTGKLLEALGQPVLGLDASSGMLALARSTVGCPLVLGDLEQLPLADRSVRGAFGNFSYQHVPRRRLDGALAELRRVLDPGGAIEIAVQIGVYEGPRRPGDDLPGRWYALWHPSALQAKVRDAGFEVVTAEERDGRVRLVGRLPSAHTSRRD